MSTHSYYRDGNTIYAVEPDVTTGHDLQIKVAIINRAGVLQPSKGCSDHLDAIKAFLADIGDEIEPPAAPVEAPSTKHQVPPCPAEDPTAGDKTPAVIAWWHRYHPGEAATRYANRRFTMPD